MKSFYSNLEDRAFWRAGVANDCPWSPTDIYRKKWEIKRRWQIGTAGSCFAQHIARNMRLNGYNVLDVEPAPSGLPKEMRQAFGYSLYSGRYGNIYTTRQLLQLIEEVFAENRPKPLIWEKDGRFYDALRPSIEPDGFASEKELIEAREYHLERLRMLFLEFNVFVFTLGMTEAWMHTKTERIVPIAPGVIAGENEVADYSFVNFDYNDVVSDMRKATKLLNKQRDKPLRVLLTVSPVPLTATATENHVLAATAYSKATLRAAAGALCETNPLFDYFPSYEIVTHPAARGTMFSGNLRSVSKDGVAVVMKTFFSQHPPFETGKKDKRQTNNELEDLQCEDALLEAFGK